MKQHTVIKNSLITAGILGAATGFCFLIQEIGRASCRERVYVLV